MINIAFPYYVLVTLHHSVFAIGLIFVAATLATAVFTLLFGMTTDTWDKRGTLLLTSALLPVSALMVYFSSNLWVVVAAAMLGGYSATGSLASGGVGGAVQPIQTTILAELTSEQNRTRYFSLFIFLAAATGAGGALAAKLFSIHALFLVAAAIAACAIPPLWFVKCTASKGKIRTLKTKDIIGKFSMTGMLNGFAQGLVIPFLIPFFLLVYNLPKAQMSEYTFLSGLLGALALLTAPTFERYLGFLKSMLVTRGVGIILLALFPIVRFLPFSVFVYLTTPAFRVAAAPIQQAELTRRVHDQELGRALGMNQVARLVASAVGTGLSGYLLNAGLFEIPFFIYGFVMTVNLYLYVRFFGRVKQNIQGVPLKERIE